MTIVISTASMAARPASAQLSPGPLSRPHADLDGIKNCNQCHQFGHRDVAPQCLACHVEIQAMHSGGKGLHARPEYSDCATCHKEHNGEDYDLVFWADGRDKFDHGQVGFALEGAHAKLDCRKCHNIKYIAEPGKLRGAGKDPDRTFLGLYTSCAECHRHPHREQFVREGTQQACTDCHNNEKWKPATRFDHARSAFALTGKHLKVDCEKCHKPLPAQPDARPTGLVSLRFRPLDFADCTSCHKDPHAGTLGPTCTQCHVTDDWKTITGEGFDHSRTRYPLEGKHAAVACKACHVGEGHKKPPFAKCRDCHRDAHEVLARNRPELMVCEDCHTVQGFRPARFDVDKHQKTTFPLRGAHPAVPCFLCHKPLESAAARKAPYDRASELFPVSDACTACHRDPHEGQPAAHFAKLEPATTKTGDGVCLSCHTENSWLQVAQNDATFDHDHTAFKLEGRHRAADCKACHKPTDTEPKKILFKGAATLCAACHDDVHKGLFQDKLAADGKSIACDRCHVTTDWLAERFDHDEDSRFPLRGGHEKVACKACHLPLSKDNERLLHFKPLPIECRDCHANDPAKLGGKT